MRTINEKGQEVWIKEPRWIDKETSSGFRSSNSELISQMEKELEKYR